MLISPQQIAIEERRIQGRSQKQREIRPRWRWIAGSKYSGVRWL